MTQLSKEEKWKKERIGKITSSQFPKLMKKGRGAGEIWGSVAKTELYAVRYEMRTGVEPPEQFNKYFDHGKENETLAIEWMRQNFIQDIKHCTDDFDEIVFRCPIEGVGDSPDALMYNAKGEEEVVVEIKCITKIAKIEEGRECKEIHDKHEYYWQFLGHFIGSPHIDKLLYLEYDAFSDDAHYLWMHRKDHQKNIEILTERLLDAVLYLKSDKKISNINNQAEWSDLIK